jgi:mono/diheme cytochrome c family protein
MRSAAKTGLTAAATLAALALGGAAFIESGYYNIGADDHHTKFVLRLIEQLRERSIDEHARSIEVPALVEPRRVAEGARRYAALCAGCHLAPGMMRSEIRAGLYPHPPNLAEEAPGDARRVFWTIKHGIKMSAMPAWGKTLDDSAVWDLVSFVRTMPSMSPEQYRELTQDRAQ